MARAGGAYRRHIFLANLAPALIRLKTQEPGMSAWSSWDGARRKITPILGKLQLLQAQDSLAGMGVDSRNWQSGRGSGLTYALYALATWPSFPSSLLSSLFDAGCCALGHKFISLRCLCYNSITILYRRSGFCPATSSAIHRRTASDT